MLTTVGQIADEALDKSGWVEWKGFAQEVAEK